MAITEQDIIRVFPTAARSKVVMRASVLDVAFDVFLSEMHRRDLFEVCKMVFKGGTALRKFHFGHKGRFSFDLDFDAEEGAEQAIAEELNGCSFGDFEFEISERRTHYLLKVASSLFPEGSYEVKMDFSRRGCWLPPDERTPLSSPALPEGVWDEGASIPTLRLEENVAEKLSRWQHRRLVRDLYDLAASARHIDELSLVAKMYVLKSHKNWSAMLPSRRPAQAAGLLSDVTSSTRPSDFVPDDLVQPSALADGDRTKRMRDDLVVVGALAKAIDGHIEGTALEEIAADTGRLGWRADQEIEALKAHHRALRSPSHSRTPPHGLLAQGLMEEQEEFDIFGLADLEPSPGGRSPSTVTCGKWMPRARAYCVLSPRHAPPCRSSR